MCLTFLVPLVLFCEHKDLCASYIIINSIGINMDCSVKYTVFPGEMDQLSSSALDIQGYVRVISENLYFFTGCLLIPHSRVGRQPIERGGAYNSVCWETESLG